MKYNAFEQSDIQQYLNDQGFVFFFNGDDLEEDDSLPCDSERSEGTAGQVLISGKCGSAVWGNLPISPKYVDDNLKSEESEESEEERLEKLLKPSSEDFWGIR